MYVKQFDSEGNLLNPITKQNPFVTGPSMRRAKRMTTKERKKSKMIYTMVGRTSYVYKVTLQKIGSKVFEHYHLIRSFTLPFSKNN